MPSDVNNRRGEGAARLGEWHGGRVEDVRAEGADGCEDTQGHRSCLPSQQRRQQVRQLLRCGGSPPFPRTFVGIEPVSRAHNGASYHHWQVTLAQHLGKGEQHSTDAWGLQLSLGSQAQLQAATERPRHC